MLNFIVLFWISSMALFAKDLITYGPVDELYASFFISSAELDNAVLMTYFTSSSIEFSLYDFETDSVGTITDGRIPFGIYTLNSTKNGDFALMNSRLSPFTRLIFMSKNGEFKDSRLLQSFSGFPNNIEFGLVSAKEPGVFLVTYNVFDNAKQYFVGELDIENESFEILKTFKRKEDFFFNVAFVGGHYLKFEYETGRITLLDSVSFSEVRDIRPPDLLQEETSEIVHDKYKNVVNSMLLSRNGLAVLWFTQSKYGQPLEKPLRSVLRISPDLKVSYSKEFIIGQNATSVLKLVEESGQFLVEKK